jgi:NAD(P)-dependent dehydrogenase (short-subunit alcohol dehydrogenase family)
VCAELIASGARAAAISAHVGREEGCRRLILETLSRFERIDIVRRQCGLEAGIWCAVSELSDETWQKVLDTNLIGAWRLARRALPIIAAQGGGAMVFVSSINGRLGVPRAGVYGGSKAVV